MKKVFWSKCKMFRNLHSFHGAFFCSDTYLRVTSLSASYPLSARHFPICEALPYLRGTFLSARHFPICKATLICELPFICEALPYLGATPYLRATSLSASHPLSVSHFPIWEPPPICEPLPYLRATPYLWVTSLSGSHPLSALSWRATILTTLFDRHDWTWFLWCLKKFVQSSSWHFLGQPFRVTINRIYFQEYSRAQYFEILGWIFP